MLDHFSSRRNAPGQHEHKPPQRVDFFAIHIFVLGERNTNLALELAQWSTGLRYITAGLFLNPGLIFAAVVLVFDLANDLFD